MEYQRKSYKKFVLYMIFFIVLYTAQIYLIPKIFPDISNPTFTRIVAFSANVLLLLLFYIIYKTESIYWINGMSYEEAKSMSSVQRKKYAWEHFIKFFQGAVIYFIYCIISYLLKDINSLDFIGTSLFGSAFALLIIIISAIRTIPIKP